MTEPVYVYPDYVFRGGGRGLIHRVGLGAVIVGTYLVGLWTLMALTEVIQSTAVAFLLTLFLTTSLNFIFSRAIFRGRTSC